MEQEKKLLKLFRKLEDLYRMDEIFASDIHNDSYEGLLTPLSTCIVYQILDILFPENCSIASYLCDSTKFRLSPKEIGGCYMAKKNIEKLLELTKQMLDLFNSSVC